MTRRGKQILILTAWAASFFLIGIGVWNFQAGHLFLILYLNVSFLVYGLYALLSRCPACGGPLLARPVKLFGMELYFWMLLTPRQCRHCGADIEKE